MTPTEAHEVRDRLHGTLGPGFPAALDWTGILADVDHETALTICREIGRHYSGLGSVITPEYVRALAVAHQHHLMLRAATRAQLHEALEDAEQMGDHSPAVGDRAYTHGHADGVRRALHILDGTSVDQSGHDVVAAAALRGDCTRGLLWQRYFRESVGDGESMDEARRLASERIGLGEDR